MAWIHKAKMPTHLSWKIGFRVLYLGKIESRGDCQSLAPLIVGLEILVRN